MTLDLDALEALWRDQRYSQTHKLLDALPELLRLARLGQRVERDAKETKCSI